MRALLLTVALVGLSTEASAFECKVSDRYEWLSLRWNQRTIPYGVRAGASAELHDLETAFSEWSSNSCTDLVFEYVGVVSEEDDVNQVVFVTENWVIPGGDRKPREVDAVAVTVTSYSLEDGEIKSSVIEVNQELFSFTDASENCVQGAATYDLRAVLTHEVGHFIGLDHTNLIVPDTPDPTMAPRVGECETDKRTLEEDDIDALCKIYPRGQPSRSCGELPPESEYVANQAFGCTHVTSSDASPLWLLLGLLVLGIRRRRP